MRGLLFLILLSLWSAAAPAAAQSIHGLWVTQDRGGLVRIGPCGPRSCGWIARVMAGGPGVPAHDVNNPDPALRGRAIIGLPVLTGFSATGGGGRAYDPQSGRSYRTTLSLNPNGSLTVTGCVMMFCRTKVWTRVR